MLPPATDPLTGRSSWVILATMSHIGIDARLLHYREGGIATYIRRVIEALAALDNQADYTVLYSRKDRRSTAPGPGFRRASLWTPCHHRLERWTLAAELIPRRLDLLHSPDFIPPLAGARHFVITVHDLNFLHYPRLLTAESRRYYNGQIARAVRQADHILADSEATRADLMTMLDVPAEKISVHLLGVESAFRPLAEEEIATACRDLDVPRGSILFVGTFEPRKNVTGLLRAYRRLRELLPDAPPLVLAGRRGWLFEEIFASVQMLELSEVVLWREDVPPALLPGLYNTASVLAIPSFYEGFGLTALEAMACGVPVLASDRSSLPEVVGEAGLLVDPDDVEDIARGLYALLTDAALRQRLRSDGLARAAGFTWQHTAAVVHRVYRQVLAG